jgi:DNA repair protein RadA/Sms
MAKKSATYTCSECGGRFHRWSGKCPNCEVWDSLVEDAGSSPGGAAREPAPVVALSEVAGASGGRLSTGMGELDRVLGGGVLPGSAVLVGGAPGVGKSTLLLQALGAMQAKGVRCLYLSCEESLDQVRMRAERVGLRGSRLQVSCEATLDGALAVLSRVQPAVAVVDSIQRIAVAGTGSPAGSLKQVTVCADELTAQCKASGFALFLVGHVTKQGMIAGPRALEHLVDTVLYFESERGESLRVLRAAKNRFGAVNEIGVFEMLAEGLRDVENPSRLFLSEREEGASGSVVTATLEGSRAILVEVQALVAPKTYGTPERKVSGVDYRRFSMMLSVLEKQARLEVSGCDAFVNVPGGVRLTEPAADLPLVLALASSACGRAFPADTVVVGEVGLGGEVRAVGRLDQRIGEARRLGFGRAVVPASGVGSLVEGGPELIGVRHLGEALSLF